MAGLRLWCSRSGSIAWSFHLNSHHKHTSPHFQPSPSVQWWWSCLALQFLHQSSLSLWLEGGVACCWDLCTGWKTRARMEEKTEVRRRLLPHPPGACVLCMCVCLCVCVFAARGQLACSMTQRTTGLDVPQQCLPAVLFLDVHPSAPSPSSHVRSRT